MPAAIVTRDLTKRYGPLTALDACCLEVEAGRVFGLLGPNGAGKSTLIRCLLGFLTPTSGAAEIGGLDCQRQSLEVRRKTAYLPGEPRLPRMLRGHQVLRYFAGLRGESPRAAREVAERLELDLSRRVAAMSTGMRQKLAVAVTVGCSAPTVILDEPTANLDPTARQEVLAVVREARRAGRTVLFSSHVLSEIEEECDCVAILRRGRVALLEDLTRLRRRHRIVVRLREPALPPPAGLPVSVRGSDDPLRFTIDVEDDLPEVLRYLAGLPLEDVVMEPVGLLSVYQQVHAPPGTTFREAEST